MRPGKARVARAIAALALAATLPTDSWAQVTEATPPATESVLVGAPTYDPENRRDPFISLLARGVDTRTVSKASTDVGGLATDDITVKGIVMSRQGFVAMIQAPDRRTFIVRQDDQLLDGRVKAITASDVIITQDVNDPLSIVKHRDVHKALRVLDQGQ
jgi:hypothetical protein